MPFFCTGSPAALAWGRGDRLLPCPPPPPALVVVATPQERLRTADAYREASAGLSLPPAAVALSGSAPHTWTRLASLAHNDFEPVAFRRAPVLAGARVALLEQGAVVAGLTGSGTAVFGVFPREGAEAERQAQAAARAVAALSGAGDVDVRIVPTLDQWPVPSETPARHRS